VIRVYFLILIALLIFTGHGYCDSTLVFQWDLLSTPVDNYQLFQRSTDTAYDFELPVWTGDSNSTTITVPPGDYCFVLRASYANTLGLKSNEIRISLSDSPPPNIYYIPGRVTGFRLIFED